MYIDLYNLLYASILTSMTTGDYGYYELNGTSSYDSVYTKVWDAYIAVWEKAEEDPSYVETEEFGTGVAAMFRAVVELRPNQQLPQGAQLPLLGLPYAHHGAVPRR